jgi:hypothetical protein
MWRCRSPASATPPACSACCLTTAWVMPRWTSCAAMAWTRPASGSHPGRMGLYFLTPGAAQRSSQVLYDRADSAFSRGASAIDWDAALVGAGWLHVSGVTAAIGPDTAKAAVDAVRAARRLGLTVSMDCNYRATLWQAWDGDAPAILGRCCPRPTWCSATTATSPSCWARLSRRVGRGRRPAPLGRRHGLQGLAEPAAPGLHRPGAAHGEPSRPAGFPDSPATAPGARRAGR